MLPRFQAPSFCFCLFFLLMKDAVEVSAMGRSPEMYIEPIARPPPSLVSRTPQASAKGALNRFLAQDNLEQQSQTPFFHLAALAWRRSLKMPTSFSDLNIFGGAKIWALFFAILVLVWVILAVTCKFSFDMVLNVALPRQKRVRPSEYSEQQERLIKELESAVLQSGARLPRGLHIKDNVSKPPSPCKTPPQEEMQCKSPYLQVAPELSWVNGMVRM
mmetsp:Transcript_32300/g.57137  ORF Transcript_32300/g.57137 Transcript_32300/m.57137 type:complete len:217 (+) Transcript_32300:86-736(+)